MCDTVVALWLGLSMFHIRVLGWNPHYATAYPASCPSTALRAAADGSATPEFSATPEGDLTMFLATGFNLVQSWPFQAFVE